MASILPFIRNKSDFDDEATRLIGEAFDAACKGLRDTKQPVVVQEVIAKRIIKAAMKGERDPARFRSEPHRIGAQGEKRRLAETQDAGEPP
jgi:hypothetical protein